MSSPPNSVSAEPGGQRRRRHHRSHGRSHRRKYIRNAIVGLIGLGICSLTYYYWAQLTS
jgi:hypothetical protein